MEVIYLSQNDLLSEGLEPMPASFGVLQIGITSRCNQICKHCPRETRYEGFETMSLDTFNTYLSKFDPKKYRHFLISDFGEVTIIPELLEYLRSAKSRGFQGVHFVTNATRKDKRFWEAIANERLVSTLIVSLEAVRDPLYNFIRGNEFANFREVLGFISDSFSSVTPAIPFKMSAVCMRDNLNQLADMVDLATEVGASQLDFVHLNPTNYANRSIEKMCIPEQHLSSCDRQEILGVFSEVIRRAKEKALRILLPEEMPELTGEKLPEAVIRESPKYLCTQPFNWVQVGMDGQVYPCCQMSQRVSMGNVQNQSFNRIWAGTKYTNLLTGLKPGGTPIAPCLECNIYHGKRF
jgi:radical SAM protein with 4Fe4S-binding SPASM domain